MSVSIEFQWDFKRIWNGNRIVGEDVAVVDGFPFVFNVKSNGDFVVKRDERNYVSRVANF